MQANSRHNERNFKRSACEIEKPFNLLVKGPKPLQKLRIYLDIKNRTVSAKVENKVKELGGQIEVFFVGEVGLVVVDRAPWEGSPRAPAASPPASGDELAAGAARRNPRTRAEAMIERARDQHQHQAQDPIANAKRWGIPIWPAQKVLHWLEKVSRSVKAQDENKKTASVVKLSAPFIKCESFTRAFRPSFYQFKFWPKLNIFGEKGSPIFTKVAEELKKEESNQMMTRKCRPRLSLGSEKMENAKPVSGHCEICRTDYTSLADHLRSDTHQRFVNDDANYVELDTLIDRAEDRGLERFLHANGVHHRSYSFRRSARLPKVTLRQSPRTRASSVCEKMRPPSPAESETGHRLRSKGQLYLPSSLIGTTAEDDCANKVNSRQQECRKSLQFSAGSRKSEDDHYHQETENHRPITNGIGRSSRSKRPSADERLVTDNKSYYKVEVLNSKLRSSGRDNDISKTVPEENHVQPMDQGLVVKFRKVRKSQLSVLSDEAENFMFPRRDNTPPVSENNCIDKHQDSPNSKRIKSEEIDREESEAAASSCESETGASSNKKQRRRRTHAEVFINDNEKYYKFEKPGSRLRYQGSFFTPTRSSVKKCELDGASPPKEDIKEEPDDEEEKTNGKNSVFKELRDLKFSFEVKPTSEPWYHTYERQDLGQMYYTCYSDSGYWKPLLLPYELPYIPPLDPKVCEAEYQRLKSENPATPSTSVSADTGDQDSRDCPCEQPSTSQPATGSRRKKRKRFANLDGHPRKSPRKHASTLAILSSLLQQRKRRSKGTDSDTSKPNISTTTEPEQEESKKQDFVSSPDRDIDTINRNIEEMLNGSMEGLDDIDIATNPDLPEVRTMPDAIAILQNCDNLPDSTSLYGSECDEFTFHVNNGNVTRRGRKRKKNKNKTGWPKKRIVIRRAGPGRPSRGRGGRGRGRGRPPAIATVTAASSEDSDDQSLMQVRNSIISSPKSNRGVHNSCSSSNSADVEKPNQKRKRNTSIGSSVDCGEAVPVARTNVKCRNRTLRSGESTPSRRGGVRGRTFAVATRGVSRKVRANRGRWYRNR